MLQLTEEQKESVVQLGVKGYSLRAMSAAFSKEYPLIFTSWMQDYYKGEEPDYDFFLKNGHQPFGIWLAANSNCIELFIDYEEKN